jgi:hypothetical protein
MRSIAAFLVATAWFLVVGELPDADGSAGAYLGGCVGALMVGFAALAPLNGRDDPVGLAVFGLGAVLLSIALVSLDVGHQANTAEALFAASAGLLFGWAFAAPTAVIALPLLVAGIDLAAVFTGPEDPLRGSAVDILTFDLPRLGGGTAARFGLLDATFLAMFAGWSLRYALRPRLVIPLMVAAVAGSVALSLALGRPIPALPLVAVAFLLPAADRLRELLARGDDR